MYSGKYYFETDNFKLIYNDIFKAIKKLEDKSVDMIFADPPYFLSGDGITCSGGKMVSVNKGKWDEKRSIKEKHNFNKRWIRACKNVLKDNLKLTIFLEFIMSTFTFNIWIELAIIPIITIITVMNVMTERKEEYRTVDKLSDFVLGAAGFWILYETIKIGVNEYKELNALNTLVSFMIPIAYLILIIPLEYALELYSKYELLFVRMAFKEEKNKKVKRRRRISIIRACKLSVRRVLLFQREYYGKMYVTMKDEEFEQLMKDFRNTCKKRNDV